MEILEPKAQPVGAVLVIHSWWGLTDSFRHYGASLAEFGFLVGLADLFDGQLAATETEAKALRAKPRRIPMSKNLAANIQTLRKVDETNRLKLGIVGFSMGGHWAVWLSQRPEYGVDATILYYAARGGSFDRCKASILAHFADHDEWVSPQARKTMERAIHKSGCQYTSHDYPGTMHWFAETEQKNEFDGISAGKALDRDLAFLRTNLVY